MSFTPREVQVLRAIRHGGAKSYIRIAQLLEPAVAQSTAEMHVRNIAEKLREHPDYRDGPPLLLVTLYAREVDEDALELARE